MFLILHVQRIWRQKCIPWISRYTKHFIKHSCFSQTKRYETCFYVVWDATSHVVILNESFKNVKNVCNNIGTIFNNTRSYFLKNARLKTCWSDKLFTFSNHKWINHFSFNDIQISVTCYLKVLHLGGKEGIWQYYIKTQSFCINVTMVTGSCPA